MNNVHHHLYQPSVGFSSELTVEALNVNHHHNTHHRRLFPSGNNTSLCSSQMELTVVKVMLVGLITMTALLAFVEMEVEATPLPSARWPEYRNFLNSPEYQRRAANECDLNSDVRELCQRCAKATKSKWAYSLCCEGKENTTNFCRNFLDFSSYSSAPLAI